MVCFVEERIQTAGTLHCCLDNNKILNELQSGIFRDNSKINRERKCVSANLDLLFIGGFRRHRNGVLQV